MLSFRVPEDDAVEVQRWAVALGVDRSEILRDALHRHLVALRGADDADPRGRGRRRPRRSSHLPTSRTGEPPKSGQIGPMQRGEIWFAATPGGDRPVLVLTRDPVAGRIGAVVVAAITRTRRGSGLRARADRSAGDGVPSIDFVVNFDNVHTINRSALRRRVTALTGRRMTHACRALRDALGC